MEIKHGLHLSQRPALIMTQRLQQALKLLQVPTLELQQIIKDEITQNPLLEEVDDIAENEDEQKLDGEETALQTNEREPESTEDTPDSDPKDEIDWTDFMQDDLDRSYIPQSESNTEFFEKVPVRRESLSEHLTNELHLLTLSEEDLALGEVLIGSLDDRGYLATPVEVIAELTGVTIEEIERVLRIVQTLDPPGVGARDLRECLLIQLRSRGHEGTLVWRIVDEQFENLKNNKKAEIARALRVTPEQVQDATDALGQLSPKPGLEVSDEEVKYVVPDLLVERVGEDYVVLLNDKNVPRLRINQAYEAVLKGQRKADSTEREYIKGKLNSARWLIQTIEQRRKTMIKVMTCIIQEQREFFEKGIQFLRPLTLQQVARQIGMHESTVSRVTTNKYVQTPRGVFELKFFFSSGLTTDDGEDVSAKTAKDRIKNLISEEDSKDPLSDQKIAEMLHSDGLNIARRTVAKYREQLRILPARFRRRV
ncbi:MAG: RNA polymerase factor sigma-54 [Candidatus Eiseniibacteriota bacterium]